MEPFYVIPPSYLKYTQDIELLINLKQLISYIIQQSKQLQEIQHLLAAVSKETIFHCQLNCCSEKDFNKTAFTATFSFSEAQRKRFKDLRIPYYLEYYFKQLGEALSEKAQMNEQLNKPFSTISFELYFFAK